MTRQIVENSSTGISHAMMPGASPLASTNPTTTSIRFYWGNNRQTKAYSWQRFKNAVNIINGGK
jgi:hypothetical protein